MRDEEAWWKRGAGFKWCWPRFNVYIPASECKRHSMGFNRYPHNIIGLYVVIFGRCWGVRWKRS